jgi:hypothetical protein
MGNEIHTPLHGRFLLKKHVRPAIISCSAKVIGHQRSAGMMMLLGSFLDAFVLSCMILHEKAYTAHFRIQAMQQMPYPTEKELALCII